VKTGTAYAESSFRQDSDSIRTTEIMYARMIGQVQLMNQGVACGQLKDDDWSLGVATEDASAAAAGTMVMISVFRITSQFSTCKAIQTSRLTSSELGVIIVHV